MPLTYLRKRGAHIPPNSWGSRPPVDPVRQKWTQEVEQRWNRLEPSFNQAATYHLSVSQYQGTRSIGTFE